MMLRMLLISAVAAVGACAPAQHGADHGAAGSIAAPTPSDIAVRINAVQKGQTVAVGVGQRFAVELVGVPTAGYVWALAQAPDFVATAGEASGNTTQAQSQPGFVGGNHWEVLMFVANAPGTGELVIEQRRPWESDEPANDTFRVTIVAQ